MALKTFSPMVLVETGDEFTTRGIFCNLWIVLTNAGIHQHVTDVADDVVDELAAFVVEVGLVVVLADDLVEKLGREVKSVLRVAQQLLGLFVVTAGKQRSG